MKVKKLTPAEYSEIMRARGKLGGPARNAALSPERRSEIARKAAYAMHEAQGTRRKEGCRER